VLAQTHIAIGLIAALLLKMQVNPPNDTYSTIAYYALFLTASILPDIDHNGSTINRIFGITKVFSWLFKHRGFFHSIWPAVIGTGLLLTIQPGQTWTALTFFAGYTTHLLTDSTTLAGVNWLYPASRFTIKGPLKTGGVMEAFVFAGAVAATLYLIL